jgi:hypothetical protein
MAVTMVPLFGLTCTEALPPGRDADCAGALLEAAPLKAAVERGASPALATERDYDYTPAPEPDYQPSPGPAPRR